MHRFQLFLFGNFKSCNNRIHLKLTSIGFVFLKNSLFQKDLCMFLYLDGTFSSQSAI